MIWLLWILSAIFSYFMRYSTELVKGNFVYYEDLHFIFSLQFVYKYLSSHFNTVCWCAFIRGGKKNLTLLCRVHSLRLLSLDMMNESELSRLLQVIDNFKKSSLRDFFWLFL